MRALSLAHGLGLMAALAVTALVLTGPALAASCRSEAGPRQANEYVQDCLAVSAATHPPCNVTNPCTLILDEIRRSCEGVDGDATCDKYRDG